MDTNNDKIENEWISFLRAKRMNENVGCMSEDIYSIFNKPIGPTAFISPSPIVDNINLSNKPKLTEPSNMPLNDIYINPRNKTLKSKSVLKEGTDDLDLDLDLDICEMDVEEEETTEGLPEDFHISTKTKSAFLSKPIDINSIFWKLPVLFYETNEIGIIKKQIKVNLNKEIEIQELEERCEKIREAGYVVDDYVIKNIVRPSGLFKNTRKISIGVSKKDLLGKNVKKKGAFYNCFVILLRYREKEEDDYREYHMKVFNTGKIEVPGIQKDYIFKNLLDLLISILNPLLKTDNSDSDIIPTLDETTDIYYRENVNEMVIINSNFYCGFQINREKLYEILKNKYNLQVIYDSCSYPGIKCKFYYNSKLNAKEQTGICPAALDKNATVTATLPPDNMISAITIDKNMNENENEEDDIEAPKKPTKLKKNKKEKNKDIQELSFMIFRTGKILIVGKCDENILKNCYSYLQNILQAEYSHIYLDSNLFKESLI